MLLFKRIFNFEKAKVDQMEQRLNQRYTPGAAFPLQAWLACAGREWPARVQNLSGNGVGLEVADPSCKVARGDPAKVRLAFGSYRQTIDGRLVQVRSGPHGIYCGVGLHFGDFLEQKAYLQLLQPVTIGQSLQPVAGDRLVQSEPQLIKQVFRGDDRAVLTVWLEQSPGTPLHSFEFEMQDYFCRADVLTGKLEAYTLESADTHKGKASNPVFDTSGGLHTEIRQLFRWILPNLSPAVPDDVRAFLQRFAA